MTSPMTTRDMEELHALLLHSPPAGCLLRDFLELLRTNQRLVLAENGNNEKVKALEEGAESLEKEISSQQERNAKVLQQAKTMIEKLQAAQTKDKKRWKAEKEAADKTNQEKLEEMTKRYTELQGNMDAKVQEMVSVIDR